MDDIELEKVREELAATGTLRVGLNMSNKLLVSGESAGGTPTGVSPDLGAEIARRLGVAAVYVRYPTPGALFDAADTGAWDIGNLGAEPQRAEKIAFTAAYCEIQASYLVAAGSGLTSIEEVDAPGRKVVFAERAAYGLWLARNLTRAQLSTAPTATGAQALFRAGGFDALAGLRVALEKLAAETPGAAVLPGRLMAVQQSVGTPKARTRAARWLSAQVDELKASGWVAAAIARHGVEGLTVAP